MEKDIEIIKKQAKNQKILLILLSIVLVLSIGVSGYFIYDSMKDHETNNDLNNQTGNNNNVNNEANNNNGVAKTSLQILNDLVNRGYLKESNLASKEDYESFAYINNKGQFVIKNRDDNKNVKEIVADEINGKVSKVDLLIGGGAVNGFIVITEDGKLYSQNKFSNYEYDYIFARSFEEINLPSPIAKIYEGGVYPTKYYVLLENNEVYELKTHSNANTDIVLGSKLSDDTYIEMIDVSSMMCSTWCYPILKFTYNGKTYFDNENSVYEIKNENNKSISAKYAIANSIEFEDNDDIVGNSDKYINAYIVDVNNNIYVIPKISENNDGEHKINTHIKKHSTKKVKTVVYDFDKYEVTITYEDSSKETMNGFSVEVVK